MPTPADIAGSGLMLVLYVALALFVAKFGLTILGYGRFYWIAELLGLAFLATAIFFALKGFMGVASAINHGKWPN